VGDRGRGPRLPDQSDAGARARRRVAARGECRDAIERGLADMHEDRCADEETIAAISRKARIAPVNKSAR
jgi:hypothetical protein